MKMDELIIEMSDGVLNGVYSLDPTLREVTLYSNEDENDKDYMKAYWRNKLLVETGCVSDISKGLTDVSIDALHSMSEKEKQKWLALFADKLDANEKLHFLEGFLYAWATVNQKIAQMCCSSDGGKWQRGKELFEFFKPTFRSWLAYYDNLFNELWKYADPEGEM